MPRTGNLEKNLLLADPAKLRIPENRVGTRKTEELDGN